MAEELAPEICVIGGGPGGIAVAMAAVAAGVSVVLIEKAETGGANLASGTVPARALAAAADIYETLRAGPVMGISGAPLQVNLGKVRDHVAAVTAAVAANVSAERLTALGVRVIAAEARFTAGNLVAAGDVVIRARHTVIAVGSVPVIPDLPGLADVEYMTVASGFDLSRKPTHLIVLGATRHALELAQAYCRLGIETSVISDGAALAEEDPELAAIVLDRLKLDGVRIRTGVKIGSIARRRGGIRFALTDPGDPDSQGGEIAIDASHLLVVAGRTPDVENLGLAAAGITHDKDGIVVDRKFRTTNRRVYAIGDAIAGPALAGRAEQEGTALVRALVGRMPVRADATLVPVVTFTDPALATVGLSEAEARKRHRDLQVLRAPFVENDLAQAERLPAGMIKVLVAGNGRILGAAIVGRNAGELIAPWSLAIANNLPITAMDGAAAPYPTRSDIARRVAATFKGPGLTGVWPRRIIGFFRKPG